MDFSFSEEQILLRDSVEKYVREKCGVERHRTLCGTDLGFDPGAWQQFADLGWLSIPFSEELGGFSGGATDLMVVAEALGKGLVREPFQSTLVTCGGLLQAGGTQNSTSDISLRLLMGLASGHSRLRSQEVVTILLR